VPSLFPPAQQENPASGARASAGRTNPLDLPPPPPNDLPGAGASASPGGAASGGASLGITVESFNEQTRGASTVPVRRGAIIIAIKPGSPAEAAAFPMGAVIVSIDGKIVDSSDDLISAVRAARPGQEVELTYYEGRNLNRKSVRLAAAGAAGAPPGAGAAAAPSSAYGGAIAPGGSAGIARGGSFAIPPGTGPGSAPPAETPPRTGPSALGPVGSVPNRPLLQRIERAADMLARPAATSTVYDPLVMAELQSRVAAIEERLKAIESKLGGSAPPASGLGSPSATPPGPGLGSPGGTGTNP